MAVGKSGPIITTRRFTEFYDNRSERVSMAGQKSHSWVWLWWRSVVTVTDVSCLCHCRTEHGRKVRKTTWKLFLVTLAWWIHTSFPGSRVSTKTSRLLVPGSFQGTPRFLQPVVVVSVSTVENGDLSCYHGYFFPVFTSKQTEWTSDNIGVEQTLFFILCVVYRGDSDSRQLPGVQSGSRHRGRGFI